MKLKDGLQNCEIFWDVVKYCPIVSNIVLYYWIKLKLLINLCSPKNFKTAMVMKLNIEIFSQTLSIPPNTVKYAISKILMDVKILRCDILLDILEV